MFKKLTNLLEKLRGVEILFLRDNRYLNSHIDHKNNNIKIYKNYEKLDFLINYSDVEIG